jgi:hypothetical protein
MTTATANAIGSVTAIARIPSFYDRVPEATAEQALEEYLGFLERRNGSVATEGPLPLREAWLTESEGWTARHGGIDAAAFEKGWVNSGPSGPNKYDYSNTWRGAKYLNCAGDPNADKALLALLAFVKANAGEAYGVEAVSNARHRRPAMGTFDVVERVLGNEEKYHTRILLGATAQFDLQAPTGAWRPALPLRVLIGALTWSPKVLFHPVLLGAEISGLFTFNWMLQRVGEIFRDEPAVRETLEQRLMEILVDEIGHVAFNRLAVGPLGMAAAKALAPRIASAAAHITPELGALGWKESLTEFEHFDFASLPEEARRRAFFV